MFEGLSSPDFLWYPWPPKTDEDLGSAVAHAAATIARVYCGADRRAAERLFAVDSIELASFGYVPESQSWQSGHWDRRAFAVALVLSVIVVGLLMLAFILIAEPDGCLTVTYVERH
jgi:hypothetical protein